MEISKQLEQLYEILGYIYEMQGALLFYNFPNQPTNKITYEQRMKYDYLKPGEIAKKKLEDMINELKREDNQ